MKQLETKRVILRPWKIEDADSYISLVSDSAVSDAAGSERVFEKKDAGSFIADTLIPRGCCAVVLKETQEIIGNFALISTCYSDVFRSFNGHELAFSLMQQYWGLGLMSEILNTVLSYSFEDLTLDFVVCAYFTDNDRCRNMISKLGFRPVFTAPSGFIRSDKTEPFETLCMLTKDDFYKEVHLS